MNLDDLENKIVDYNERVLKQEGKTLKYDLINRVKGLAKLGLGVAAYFLTDKDYLVLLYSPIALEGLVDFFTGKHNLISSKLLKTHPKYKLEELERKRFNYNFSKGVDFQS